MKNIKMIITISLIVLIVGVGAYSAYTVYEDDQMEKQRLEEKAKAERIALEQQQAAQASIAARTKCTDTDKYSIVTLDRENAVGQDILVKGKVEGTACKYEAAAEDFEIKNSDPEYYKYQAANALVTDLGTGPSGRSLRLYDLGDKKMITEKKYFGDLELASTTLTYFGEGKVKADAKNCKDFKTLTKDGMTAVLTVEKKVDLKTFLVKEGKATKCLAVQ